MNLNVKYRRNGLLNDELYLKEIMLVSGIMYWVYGFMPAMDIFFNLLMLLAMALFGKLLLSKEPLRKNTCIAILVGLSGMGTIVLNPFSLVSCIALGYMVVVIGYLTYCNYEKGEAGLVRDLRCIAKTVLIMGTVILAISLALYLAGVMDSYFYPSITSTTLHLGRSRGTNALVGILGNANIASDFCVIYIAMALYMFRSSVRHRLIYLLCVPFGILTLFFTYSRGGYIGLVVILFVMVMMDYYDILRKDTTGQWIYTGIMCIGLFVILASILLIVLDGNLDLTERLNFTGRTSAEMAGSTNARLQLWKSGIGVLFDNPKNFFVGVGATIQDAVAQYAPLSLESALFNNMHCVYMQTVVSYGFIGLMLLLIAIVSNLDRAVVLIFRKVSLYKDLAPILGLLLALVVINLFESDFYMKKPIEGTFFWIAVGLFSAIVKARAVEHHTAGVDDGK